MNGITFSLVPVADEISPNKKVYRAYVKEARIRFISGRPRKRTVDDRQMALPGF